uniref:Mitochondrial assembly of ribosomal large subunit protein 1 n=1 Tax=Daphnia pulex TaxID=6669 RepID=A0A4Y7MUL0_DAPPU|nr:EOG090X0AI9 [Daphnia pulex]
MQGSVTTKIASINATTELYKGDNHFFRCSPIPAKATRYVINEDEETSVTLTGSVIPEESDATELLDDESWHRIGDSEEIEEFDEFEGVSLERGITGVFDIEEFVDILSQQKLDKIVVIAVPPELNYVDYMVITTGRSPKQMTAIAEFIRKVFKRRCFETDPLPVIEGKDNKDWIALDLGNIALHIFSSKTRKIYDLETLWTCGADFDDLSNEKEDVVASLMKEHTFPSLNS